MEIIMRKMHRTMRGQAFDMEALREKNANTVAAGNARMNARGDILGSGGRVIRSREEIVRDYYAANRPEVDRVAVADRLTNIQTPKTAIDPNFYRRPQPQSFDEMEFRTPEQIVAEAQALAAAAEINGAAPAAPPPQPAPQPQPRPSARKSKLVQKDE
jgi:hypothetical protein